VVAIPSLAFVPIKAADNMIMGVCTCTARKLSQMHDQKLLMLRWLTFLGGSSDIVTSIFADNGGQYYDYGSMPLHSAWIIQDTWPKIVDAPLTLRWRSFLGWSNERSVWLLTSKAGQWLLFWSMWLCNLLIAEMITLKSLTLRWPSPWRYSNSHSVRNHIA